MAAPIIPPTLTALASSKKAVTFWVLVGLVLLRDQIGLPLDWFQWLAIGYVGYALGQGMKDLGLALSDGMAARRGSERREEATE